VRFDGQVAIVTGAASGIGKAIGQRLAAEGAYVVMADVDEAAANVAAAGVVDAGGRANALRADVSNPDDAARMADVAIGAGGIDVLVNNAGIVRSTPAAKISIAEWDLLMRINATGAFLCAQAVHPAMKRGGGGRIVNVASMAGRATSTLGGAHYTTSKAAVLGLTRHLAREWAADGITVNAISPGIVDTPAVRAAADETRIREVTKTIPLGRLGEPEEIAALVAFLASPEAAYITGANVDIHGGELIIA